MSKKVGPPRGNKNAARPGHEKKYRVRVTDEADLTYIALMDTYERGIALIGYMMWQDSPESDGHSFVEWIKKHTDYGQYEEEE